MADVYDVAEYILQKQGPMTAMKLQKLVYYCQAWSLVWDEEPLFSEKIRAWRMGPVVRELYDLHKGAFTITGLPVGDPHNLSRKQKDTIDCVLSAYGQKSAQWLSDLAHMEDPWNLAREGYPDDTNCDNEITLESMAEYYTAVGFNGELI
ncbi:MAG: DUF4065 domain-containing protein [Dehalococcoidales bacterium]|nr:DUF4065 domain-containing protein [Dehalococcoidales bacterium]